MMDGVGEQNQLLLRVKPGLRMRPAAMRSQEEEAEDRMSKELKEARAAWRLIHANFEEFKKVQDAFRSPPSRHPALNQRVPAYRESAA